jgi:succinate dehydrogenase / fumarate reductase flavoprotein subunit
MLTYKDMLDLIVVDGHARGVVLRDLKSGELSVEMGNTVVLCTGGYSNVFYLSTNAMKSNVSATWRAHKRGALMSNPCYTQIHPTCIPQSGHHQSKLTLMSESLRNDGRVWVPGAAGDKRKASDIPDAERDYYLERKYPTFGNMVPRDVASRNAKYACDEGRGVGSTSRAVFLDFRDAILRDGEDTIRTKYGNLFQMYEKITGDNPYQTPMQIYPAPHYTMGGLWVDYNLESNIPGLFVCGEANFSDHGSNRLGASALMQGLADGYFVLPYTLANYLAGERSEFPDENCTEAEQALADVKERLERLIGIQGTRSIESFHRELGMVLLDKCGMSRSKEGLEEARAHIRSLRDDFWSDVKVPVHGGPMNPELEKAARVADFLEFGELMVVDAWNREESCGGHFREEHQTEEGEARRDDENWTHVSAWEFTGVGEEPIEQKEDLVFEFVTPSQRSYK